VTQDAIQTVVYAITSQVGVGLDASVNSYADRGKISTIWQGKEVGYFLMLTSVVFVMFLVASALLNDKKESVIWLQKAANSGFPNYPLYNSDPNFQSLKDSEDFKKLISRLKEDWEKYKAI